MVEHDMLRNREEIIIKQMKFLEMKSTISEMKNKPVGWQTNIAKEKAREFEE